MRFFKRNETVSTLFIAKNFLTGEPVDVSYAKYEIVCYDGLVENNIVYLSDMTRVAGREGFYLCSWEIPDTAVENQTYFIIGSFSDPLNDIAQIENVALIESFKIISDSYFGSVSSNALNVDFSE